MIYDLQKASMWKRISAFLCDFISFAILAVGVALLLSTALGVDAHQSKMTSICAQYVDQYKLNEFMTDDELKDALSLTITEERFNALEKEQQDIFLEATEALYSNKDYLYAYGMINQLILIVITFSVLVAQLLLEFVVPLLFQNGQTLGKKVFGVAVMRMDGVKVSPTILLIRTVLGKYTIETMIPVFVLLSVVLGTASIVTIILLLLLIVAQVALLLFTHAKTPLHDMLAGTVTVDFASQLIFNTPEELLEYKKKLHADSVAEKSSNS